MALDAPRLEMDEIRHRVLPQSDQRVEHRDIAYRAMHVTAELMAGWCATIVLDATYTAATCRMELMQVVHRVDGILFVVECHVDAAVAVERFTQRGAHPAIDLTPERVAALARDYPYSAEACAVAHATPAELALTTVIGHLDTSPLGLADGATWCGRGRTREATSGGFARTV